MQRITTNVEAAVYARLEELARRRSVPASRLIREALARYVSEQEAIAEPEPLPDWIGVIEGPGGPYAARDEDLSTGHGRTRSTLAHRDAGTAPGIVAALIDTSAVLAALDRADPAHERVVSALALERSTIVLPIVALPEVDFLIARRHGAATAASVMGRLVRGPWPVSGLDAVDLQRATEIMARYADSDIGFVDAAITALAERLAAVRIYTLDKRDFLLLRPRHVAAFEVLPAA